LRKRLDVRGSLTLQRRILVQPLISSCSHGTPFISEGQTNIARRSSVIWLHAVISYAGTAVRGLAYLDRLAVPHGILLARLTCSNTDDIELALGGDSYGSCQH
jgi:hypothetical protein